MSSSSSASSNSRDLFEFLTKHSTKAKDSSTNDKSTLTHTRIRNDDFHIHGGAYIIPPAELPEFYDHYVDNVFVKGRKEYLTEKQLENGGPMYVDFDFRYSYDVTERQHTKDDVENIICVYLEELKKYYNFTADTPFPVYIFEKPYVNRVEEKAITKDGIHMIIGCQISHAIQIKIRETMLTQLPNELQHLPVINTWDEILDEGITKGSTNCQLYGSRKPAHEAYVLTHHYEITFDDNDYNFGMAELNVVDFDLKKDFAKLSVQYDKHPSFEIKAKYAELKTPEKKKKCASATDASGNSSKRKDNKENQKHLELLQLVRIGKKDRNAWQKICSWIKCIGLTEEDWIAFCQTNDLNWDAEKVGYFSFAYHDVSTYYIQKFAKESDPEKYKEWVNKYDIYYIPAEDLDDPYKIASIIAKSLKDTLVLCKENWYMLTDSNLWKQQKEPAWYVAREFRKYIDKSQEKNAFRITSAEGDAKEKLIGYGKAYLKAYKTTSQPSFLNVLTKYLKTLLADDVFADKLDHNAGELAFQNGIMDLETKTFRQGISSEDFITKTIPYDYTPADEEKVAELKGYLLPILNNNPEHLEYFLSIFGYTFIGLPQKEKSIYFCVDKTDKSSGDNGKTFMFDIATTLLPNYVYKSKGSFLEEGNSKVHKQLIMMKGMRLVWLDEFGKKQANSELMKEIGDGLTVECEVMFGTSESINMMFKLFTLTNSMPVINPKDVAVYNRYKQISYGSHFDRTGSRTEAIPEELLFIADTSLGDKIKTEYYNEFFELIIEYAHKYYTRQFKLPNIPSQFVKDTKETQKNNDTFAGWFEENCVEDAASNVADQLIITTSKFTKDVVREGMKRLGYKYDKDLGKLGKDSAGKYYKGGYIGVKIREEEVDEMQA